MGRGYSSDDNRSMQLNPNNDRYYSSRGIDRDDLDWDYDEDDNNETGEIMLFEIGNRIINSRNIVSIYVENCDVNFEIKTVKNDDWESWCDEGYKSKKKVRMLSILVDVDASTLMNEGGSYDFTIYANKTDGVTENKHSRSEYISYSQYFPEISYNLSLKPRVICIDRRTDCDDVEAIKQKIRFEIQSTVNQFVIAYVNQVMKKQRSYS